MKKKYLFIANGTKPSKAEYESYNEITLNNFSIPCLDAALALNYTLYMGINRKYASEIACLDYKVLFYNAKIFRSVFALNELITSYRNLCFFLSNNNIDTIHCNTPIGGVIGRICGRKYGVRKIIYTAHGFHFYKGAPLVNRTLFYWIEKYLARYTDAIITINQEDFLRAQGFRLKPNGKIFKINGVGINTAQSDTNNLNTDIRQELCIESDSILLISVGDINDNKNNNVVIRAMKNLDNMKLHYLLCGVGEYKVSLMRLVKKFKLEKNIHFLGYRSDVDSLLKQANIFLLPSKREGLSRSLMEAMNAGLPCIVSRIRGNTDLIDENLGGYLCKYNDVYAFARAINQLSTNIHIGVEMGKYNKNRVKEYDIENVKRQMLNIYKEILL